MREYVAVGTGHTDLFDLATTEPRYPDQMLRAWLSQASLPPTVLRATHVELPSSVRLSQVAPQPRAQQSFLVQHEVECKVVPYASQGPRRSGSVAGRPSLRSA